MKTTVAKEVALRLLAIEAIKLSPDNPFNWSSGWNSPIYCDNRVALSYPEVRSFIKQSMKNIINKKYTDIDVIVGVATGGIAIGALVAEELNLPFAYVRPEPKKHGMGNQIEGRVEKGQRVLVIEDLISTGGSSLKVVDLLKSEHIEVVGMVAIFTYGFDVASAKFKENNVQLDTLSDYGALMEVALENDYVTEAQIAHLTEWRLSPATWGK